jgi:hypothetical protein
VEGPAVRRVPHFSPPLREVGFVARCQTSPVIPTGVGAKATAERRNLLFGQENAGCPTSRLRCEKWDFVRCQTSPVIPTGVGAKATAKRRNLLFYQENAGCPTSRFFCEMWAGDPIPPEIQRPR